MSRWKIVVLVVVVMLALTGVGIARFLMPYQLEDEIATAHAQGVGTSYTQCYPSFPSGQDAGPDYDRAKLLSAGFWTADMDKAREALAALGGPTHAEMDKVRAAFDKHRTYIAAIHAGAAKPDCSNRPATAEDGYNRCPRMGEFRDAVKILRDEANLHMWEGKPIEAAKTLRLAQNVAKQASALPTIPGCQFGIAVEAIVDAGYKRLLLKAGANPVVGRIVRDSLGADLAPGDISRALAGEVVWLCERAKAVPRATTAEPFYKRAYHKAQTASTIHWMTMAAVASRVPADRQREAIQGVIDAYDRASRHNPTVKASGEMLPFALSTMDYLDAQAARRKTIYAAACVLQYRTRESRFPATLAQAVQPVPLDPFSRQPLKYTRTATGFELVSAEASRRWTKQHPPRRWNDMVFSYPPPMPGRPPISIPR